MPKIAILPDLLINKIAAGEIIERPASVVRELIDNSIDAGAEKITVEALHGGKKLIKVSDDGAGMSREDALLCLERHATSKIRSDDDLFNISTLGFRGEALPSIASISKLTLITSAVNSSAGTKIEINGGKEKNITDAPAYAGTAVEVRDIFYNIPARRKFLKTIPTELSHIIDTVIQKAFPCFETAFTLKHNNSDIINVHAVKGLKERFIQLYGEELSGEFLEVKKDAGHMKLYGFLSSLDFTRAGKSYQYIFVNRRAVKNPTVNHAVYAAYSGLIPKDRHPAFFLFLDIDPQRVDVNVHPAKREVRFETPEEIHRLVESAVYDALRGGAVSGTQDKGVSNASMPGFTYPKPSGSGFYNPSVVQEQHAKDFQPGFFAEEAFARHKYFHIGECFIAAIADNRLIVIDQHAAHERVLYEKYLKKTAIETENLFLPVRVELPPREFNIIMNHKGLLNDFGLVVEEFGGHDVIIKTIPRELRKADLKGLLLDIASGIIEEEGTGAKGAPEKDRLTHGIAARLACHKSVRGSEPLNEMELSKLLSDLDKTESPDKCPHGRPTRIFFPLDELRKMFKRK
ncbi:MAG: DNA mismatch repair endonuclease MutL [Nitrospirae bacterium]|nr:DNA mismatch repair endonuclease MutL [Nitrospirota bacterium]